MGTRKIKKKEEDPEELLIRLLGCIWILRSKSLVLNIVIPKLMN
jgi:hypothetical protein